METAAEWTCLGVLAGVAFLVCVKSLRFRSRILHLPSLVALAFLGFLGPQAIGVIRSGSAPWYAVCKVLLFSALCVAAVYWGWAHGPTRPARLADPRLYRAELRLLFLARSWARGSGVAGPVEAGWPRRWVQKPLFGSGRLRFGMARPAGHLWALGAIEGVGLVRGLGGTSAGVNPACANEQLRRRGVCWSPVTNRFLRPDVADSELGGVLRTSARAIMQAGCWERIFGTGDQVVS